MNFEEFIKNKNNGTVTQSTPRAMERYFINQSALNAQDIGNKTTSFLNAIQNRYFDENGNYIDIYRSDDIDFKKRALDYAQRLSGVIDSVGAYQEKHLAGLEGLDEQQKKLYDSKGAVDKFAEWLSQLPEYTDEADYNKKKADHEKYLKTKDVYDRYSISDIFGQIEELEQLKKTTDKQRFDDYTNVVKSLSLGATACSIARPFTYLSSQGTEQCISYINELKKEIRSVMFLCNCNTIQNIQSINKIITGDLYHWIKQRSKIFNEY
jgi:hypothetical protein